MRDDNSILGPEGRLFPGECCMPGPHYHSECHTPEHLMEQEQPALSPCSADDIRAAGWVVAVHNDYRLHGVAHTFWLFTSGDRCVKGEGLTDVEALDAVRAQIGLSNSVLNEPG